MAAENSFDIVCKVDMQEVTNALDQARREIETRYDLKGAKNEIKQEKMVITLTSGDDMKLKAVLDHHMHCDGMTDERLDLYERLLLTWNEQ